MLDLITQQRTRHDKNLNAAILLPIDRRLVIGHRLVRTKACDADPLIGKALCAKYVGHGQRPCSAQMEIIRIFVAG